MAHRYTERELRFIKNNIAMCSYSETAAMFNRHFGLSITVSQLSSVISYYKLAAGRCHAFTPKEIRFLERKAAGRSFADLAELFNRHFGLSLRFSQIRAACRNRGITNGRDGRFPPGLIPHNKGKKGCCPAGCEKGWFKPGHMPHNWQPVGTEIIDENGYVKVKTRNPKTWKFKQRLIWEKAYGKIPRNRMVIFADGNRLNFALDNLLLVSRAEHAVMNRWDLRSAHGELTRAGLAVADLKMAIAGRKRGVKKKKRGNK